MIGIRGTTVRFIVFAGVCILCTFALLAVLANLRFEKEQLYFAEFADVTGLRNNDFVRIAGVEVGKVKEISINHDGAAVVQFSTDTSVLLTEETKAAIRWVNPIGDRYLALLEGDDGSKRLEPGQTIPLARTEPALDLETLQGAFRPLFRALDPKQVNALSSQLIEAFQDQGATVSSFLTHAAAVTNTLADRDTLIGQVIDNLNVVLGSLGDNSDAFASAVDSLAEVMDTLAARKSDIAKSVAHTTAATATIADLLQQARPPLANTVYQADRASATVLADHAYLENFLDTLPDAYKRLSRLGLYGDYFSFYLCDAILKVNGKGGQPVYVKLVGQDSGRCAAK